MNERDFYKTIILVATWFGIGTGLLSLVSNDPAPFAAWVVGVILMGPIFYIIGRAIR